QLVAKKEIIRDCLHRIAKIDAPDFQIVAAPNQWHYRSRAQWQFDSRAKHLGYFESGSRRVCDVAECAVLVPELQAQLENLREQIRTDSVASDARYFRAIAGDDSVSVVDNNGRNAGITQAGSELPITITRTIRGESYDLNAESFFQTDIDLLPKLIEAVLAEARGGTAIELYSGVGLFTVPLARNL